MNTVLVTSHTDLLVDSVPTTEKAFRVKSGFILESKNQFLSKSTPSVYTMQPFQNEKPCTLFILLNRLKLQYLRSQASVIELEPVS